LVGKESENASVNGEENGVSSSVDGSSEKSRRQDVIIVTGKPEDCEAAKAALMVSFCLLLDRFQSTM
jgi:hypothetical protein